MEVNQLQEIKKYHFEGMGYTMGRVFHNNYENCFWLVTRLNEW